jgi:DNA polymerase III alpha subunit (gram-positive type)
VKFFIADLETNGLKANHHEITEISILRCEDMVQRVWKLNIHNPEKSSDEALMVTGQELSSILSRKVYLEDVINEVNEFLEETGEGPDDRLIIGHNESFDRRQLEENWKRLGYKLPVNYFLDSKEMARKYIKQHLKLGRQSIALNKLLDLFNIKAEPGAHSAEVDVRNTFRLWKYLEKRGMKNIEFTKLSPTLIKKDMDDLKKKAKHEEMLYSQNDVSDAIDSLEEIGYDHVDLENIEIE